MVPVLEERVSFSDLVEHQIVRLSPKELRLIITGEGERVVEQNYNFWKSKVTRANAKGYHEPDRLVARVIMGQSYTEKEEMYSQIRQLGGGSLYNAVERLHSEELIGLTSEEREPEVVLNTVLMLANYFVKLYQERELH